MDTSRFFKKRDENSNGKDNQGIPEKMLISSIERLYNIKEVLECDLSLEEKQRQLESLHYPGLAKFNALNYSLPKSISDIVFSLNDLLKPKKRSMEHYPKYWKNETKNPKLGEKKSFL